MSPMECLGQLEEGDATLDGSTTCGYGALGALTWPGGAIGKISAKSAIFKLPERSCGACIEVTSRPASQDWDGYT